MRAVRLICAVCRAVVKASSLTRALVLASTTGRLGHAEPSDPDCERCHKEWAMYVVSGARWLCWDCYCTECRRNSGS